MQGGEFPAEVNVSFKACCVGDCLWVGDFQKKALHVGPLVFKELVHEGHVLFLVSKSEGRPKEQCLMYHIIKLSGHILVEYTHLVKLARFCVTLAMSVRVRAVRSSGYSCIKLKSEGDMMAGHRNLRNKDALIKRSLMSGRPRLLHSCRHDANTSFSSRGNTLPRLKNKFGDDSLVTNIWCIYSISFFGVKIKCDTYAVPVRVDDFAEGQLTAHFQVTLVFLEIT